jgi:hypothetical protein
VYTAVLDETFGAVCEFGPGKEYSSDDMNVYYLVTNFKTKDEVKEYLARYIT